MAQALIAIDVQNAWADDNLRTTDAIEDAVARLRAVMPIIWVYLHWQPVQKPFQAGQNPDLSQKFNDMAQEHRWNAPALRPAPEDWVITKNSESLFSNPEAEGFLREQGFTSLLMAGFMTSQCVYQSARDASKRGGFKTTVVSGLTADHSDVTDCEGKEFFERHNIRYRTLSVLGL